MRIVSTFNPKSWDAFVKRNVLSWLKHTTCELVIYHEGEQPPVEHERLVWRKWEDIPDAVAFHEEAAAFPAACGAFKDGYDYNYDVAKFGRKIWAQCDAAMEETDYLVWLDSDVELVRDLDVDVIEGQMNGMPIGTFFRPGYHCESGVVAWDMRQAITIQFFLAYISLFKRRTVYKLPNGWHDCWALDYVVSTIRMPFANFGTYSGNLDVIPGSPLGEYLRHDKGNRKYAA
jgi:hypothetical protein